MADETKKPAKPQPTPPAQPEVLHYAVPGPVLKAAIELIDEEINGKKGRQITNALERANVIRPPEATEG